MRIHANTKFFCEFVRELIFVRLRNRIIVYQQCDTFLLQTLANNNNKGTKPPKITIIKLYGCFGLFQTIHRHKHIKSLDREM